MTTSSARRRLLARPSTFKSSKYYRVATVPHAQENLLTSWLGKLRQTITVKYDL